MDDAPLQDADQLFDESGTAERVKTLISRLVQEQPYAVLCTQGAGQPYGSLVAFSATEDLMSMVFATPRATRKYRLLEQCDHVALVIDNRSVEKEDLMQIEGLTATGRAAEVADAGDFAQCAELLLARHAYLESFLAAPSTALFRVNVVRYFHVTRFQEVREWKPKGGSSH